MTRLGRRMCYLWLMVASGKPLISFVILLAVVLSSAPQGANAHWLPPEVAASQANDDSGLDDAAPSCPSRSCPKVVDLSCAGAGAVAGRCGWPDRRAAAAPSALAGSGEGKPPRAHS